MNATNELHVIFGSGALGLAVMRELVRQGKQVRLVNRSGKAEASEGVEVVKGDVSDPTSARQVCKGASVVYNCASPAYIYKEWATKWPPIINGTIEGASAAGAKLIFGDNVYMYGDTNGKPITEDLPHTAHTRKGQLRATFHDTYMRAHREGKVQVAIGRASDFYGPAALNSVLGDRAIYPALAGKKATAFGNIDLPHTYTYIDDFGKGLVTLGSRDEAMGQVWHVPNAPAISTRALFDLMFAELGQKPAISIMGKTMLRVGGLFIPPAGELVEMLYEYEKPFVVDSSKFEQAFGIGATPYTEGVKHTVEWFKSHPQVKK